MTGARQGVKIFEVLSSSTSISFLFFQPVTLSLCIYLVNRLPSVILNSHFEIYCSPEKGEKKLPVSLDRNLPGVFRRAGLNTEVFQE